MEPRSSVVEYKCPCCDAGLRFGGESQKLTCEYCGNTFDLETVQALRESVEAPTEEAVSWEETDFREWDPAERDALRVFRCPSCGGEILGDENTAATFCLYCGNPTILPERLSGGVKPDGVIPFRTGKEDARAAFLRLCKGKPLLPKGFAGESQVEKITGLYVPYWLYDCGASLNGSYRATRVHAWSDSQYRYTRTEHFLLGRRARASFSGIPMDGSSKLEDSFLESIEPFDYGALADFDMAYLTGFLADKYDVPSEAGEARIRQRVDASMDSALDGTFLGYATVTPVSRQLRVEGSKAKYVLLPVWLLNTRYRGKTYTFAMNGQTGKLTGTLPISRARAAAWFAGIWAVSAALITLVRLALF